MPSGGTSWDTGLVGHCSIPDRKPHPLTINSSDVIIVLSRLSGIYDLVRLPALACSYPTKLYQTPVVALSLAGT